MRMQVGDTSISDEQAPLVSVVLPVYNAEKTIGRAVESILEQTFSNFELLIINDGSTDRTSKIISDFSDPRISILSQENKGLVLSLNRGIESAIGKYIARMDADDISLPGRLEKQVSFLGKNPSYAIVGTATKIIYEDGKKGIRYRPRNTADIRKNIVRICPFTHSSVMIRKNVFDRVGLYDSSMDGSKELLVEDYDLWVRILAAGYDMANLSDVLMVYNRGCDSILRNRTLVNRMRQQILSRINAIKILNLGFHEYLNLIPVIILSVLTYYGVKADMFFYILSKNNKNA